MHIYFSFKQKMFSNKKKIKIKNKNEIKKIGGLGAIDQGAIVLDPVIM